MIPAYAKPGDFVLAHMSGDVATWIRIGQILNGSGFSDYEHAFVYIGHGNIVEAGGNGAVLTPYHYGTNVLWSSGIIPLTDVQREAVVTAATGYTGVGYSYADYFALAAHRLHIPAPDLKSYIATSKHMICSQLVDQAYEDAGVHLFKDGRWPGYVTPGDLWQLLQLPDRRR